MAPALSPPETLMIPVASIAIPANFRKPSPKRVAELSDSIRQEGLLQPIGVRLVPGAGYMLVFGGHRLASHKKLKLAEIEARVFEMSDAVAEAATLAENLFRNPLKPAEYIRAIKRWHELYTAEHPESVGQAARSLAASEARKKKSAPVTESGTAPEPERAPRFDQAAGAAMNVSPTKVRADALAAKNLSDSDLDTLAARDVPISVIQRIGSIKDDSSRQKAVSLVASGMDPQAAVAFATAPENATIEEVRADESAYVSEEDLEDEEWLAQFCGDALDRLEYQDAFKRDAIVWRRTKDLLGDVRRRSKKTLAQSKGFRTGPYHYRLASLLNVLHPNDWPKCGPCGGSGQAGATSHCPNCHGAGYSIATGGGR